MFWWSGCICIRRNGEIEDAILCIPVGCSQLSYGSIRFIEPCSLKIWFIEPCSTKIWFIEIGSSILWFIEIGSTKIWFIEIGSLEIVFIAMTNDQN